MVGGQTDRSSICWSTPQMPTTANTGQAEARNSMWVSLMGGRDPSTQLSPVLPPRECISRKLYLKWRGEINSQAPKMRIRPPKQLPNLLHTMPTTTTSFYLRKPHHFLFWTSIKDRGHLHRDKAPGHPSLLWLPQSQKETGLTRCADP